MNKICRLHEFNKCHVLVPVIKHQNLLIADKYLLKRRFPKLCTYRTFNSLYKKQYMNANNHKALSSNARNDSSSQLEMKVQEETKSRVSPLNIQMISDMLHQQIFKTPLGSSSRRSPTKKEIQRSISHLQTNGLWKKDANITDEIKFSLPNLKGNKLDEHFHVIGESQCRLYKLLINNLMTSSIPQLPTTFCFAKGWTKYSEDGEMVAVDCPSCSTLVFDIEVCMSEGKHPTLACAVSDKYWYTWCSHSLIENTEGRNNNIGLEDLIPLRRSHIDDDDPKLVIGHNVSFDRLAIKEEYYLRNYIRFLDTMSLHIATSGLVEEQRNLVLKNKTAEKKIRLPWMNVGCQNSLKDVYKFYCRQELAKESRDVFVKGNLEDVRENFEDLMHYCAKDVTATLKILKCLFPLFLKRFPHPVTFSGMLEMGSAYLPICDNWNKYIDSSEEKYNDFNISLNTELAQLACDALSLAENDQFKEDLWLWDLDWSLPKGKVKVLQGYPNWFRKLCMRDKNRDEIDKPQSMSTSLKIVPKLLKLTWNGYPLHYYKDYGWGYLKPNKIKEQSEPPESVADSGDLTFPYDSLLELTKSINEKEEGLTEELSGINIRIPNVVFHPLPHKDGAGNNVGNPLSKDFLRKLEDNTLSSAETNVAQGLLKKTKTISYWKNNRDRIMSQAVMYFDHKDLPSTVKESDEYDSQVGYGAILPQVVTAGTITRRAVERTWMTASNAYADRIGSELKAIIKAPPGYHFVGADVDSQELWIASVLGDAYFTGQHGSTALGWMTLQGNKAEGTDMHSKTAQTAGISRDNAKVINYGRIYGAGLKFIQRLLRQFNPSLSEAETKKRATKLFAATKGQKGFYLNQSGRDLASELKVELDGGPLARKQILRLLRLGKEKGCFLSLFDVVEGPQVWVGGSESHMFNCLESIARMEQPRTPVLGARITRALEPWCIEDQFMTSRINWVVQSSAVDFLHLMLVCMRWLFSEYKIDGRFCISIHDEVRYLVASKDRYRAALALHITNLLTRSFISMRLSLNDLPQSVSFFSGVDVDSVLRKEPHADCVTPSNPLGLHQGYGIPPGECLTIQEVLEKTGGRLEAD